MNEKRRLIKSLTLPIIIILVLQASKTFAQFTPIVELADLNGENGFILNGISAGDLSGGEVNSLGDINNDGIDDFVISAPSTDINGNNSGSIYVVFGSNTGFQNTVELSSIDGNNGFVINGIDEGDQLFASSQGGDINDDGIPDLIIGASASDPNGSSSGTTYVVFGSSTPFPTVFDLTTLNGSNGFAIYGANTADISGSSLASGGDVNGDGVDDIIVGAPGVDGGSKGLCYIVYGSDVLFSANLELSSLDGNNGFTIIGENFGDQICKRVSLVGDINNDGIEDFSLSQEESLASVYNPINYVIFGTNQGFPNTFDLSTINGSNGFRIDGIDSTDNFSNNTSVESAGDFNADGIDDFFIGYNQANNSADNSGTVYVLFGKNQPYSSSLTLSGLDGSNGFIINGIDEFDRLGSHVNTIGDVNNDGVGDIIIAAIASNNIFDKYPVSYVLFGSDEDFASVFDLHSLNGNNGFVINSFTSQTFSIVSAVSGAGDINNDGIGDILLGGAGASSNGLQSGSSYIIYGKGDLIFKQGFE